MIQIQCISKVLNTGDLSFLVANDIGEEYFTGYEEEFNFLIEHQKQYGNVPDIATFLAKFPEFEVVDCTESDQYLLDTLQEEHLYMKCVPLIQQSAKLLESDSNAAVEYLMSKMQDLQPSYMSKPVNIASTLELQKRKDEYIKRRDNPDDWFFTTGFPELDDVIKGIQRFEEYIVIVARTNQGKSWILEKIAAHVWQIGFNVGYISPEMGSLSVGYRFDSLVGHLSNKQLTWGSDSFDINKFDEHAENVKKQNNEFLVTTPSDRYFKGNITVSKLKRFIQDNNLHALFIDGITYLKDERYQKGDTAAQGLTHISEDLMSLSVELRIPILVVAQANRQATTSTDNPDLETIRDSDGIAFNASKVISIRQRDDHVLMISVKKQRTGPVGIKLCYNWDIDTGTFTYIPNGEESSVGISTEQTERKPRKRKDADMEDAF